MRTFLLGVAATTALLITHQAGAAPISLTFDGSATPNPVPACTAADGGTTDMVCSVAGQAIGIDYGSTPELAVTYDPSGTAQSLRFSTSINGATNRGAHAVQAPGAVSGVPSRIIFTPSAGFEVSFQSFQWGKTSATSSANFHFDVLDAMGTTLFSAGNSRVSYLVNTSYFTGPLAFQFTNGGRGSVYVDNIVVDVRRQGVPPPLDVPEPASLGTMLLGCLGAASVLRLRARSTGGHRAGAARCAD